MATREITTTVTTDDLTGDLGAKPRTFAIGGVEYALDLTDVNYDKLVQAVSDFVNAAARVAASEVLASASVSVNVPAPRPARARTPKRPSAHLIRPTTPELRAERNLEIQAMYLTGKYTFAALGRLYQLSGMSISNIVRRGKNSFA